MNEWIIPIATGLLMVAFEVWREVGRRRESTVQREDTMSLRQWEAMMDLYRAALQRLDQVEESLERSETRSERIGELLADCRDNLGQANSLLTAIRHRESDDV